MEISELTKLCKITQIGRDRPSQVIGVKIKHLKIRQHGYLRRNI